MKRSHEEKMYIYSTYPDLICKISGEAIVDPVRASDGKIYDRESLINHFKKYEGHQIPSPSSDGLILQNEIHEVDQFTKNLLNHLYDSAPVYLPDCKISRQNNKIVHKIRSRIIREIELTQEQWMVSIIERKNHDEPHIFLEGILDEGGGIRRYLAFIYLIKKTGKQGFYQPQIDEISYTYESDYPITKDQLNIQRGCHWMIDHHDAISLRVAVKSNLQADIRAASRLLFFQCYGETPLSWLHKQLKRYCGIDAKNLLDEVYTKSGNHKSNSHKM